MGTTLIGENDRQQWRHWSTPASWSTTQWPHNCRGRHS